MSASLRAAAETVACVAVAAWVGGHAALGAFAARIVFRDLPRDLAAPTMTTVFRSFDGVIVAGVVLLFAALVARAVALGPGALRGPHFVAALAGLLLVGAGVLALAWVHPAIEHMFSAGETLTPRFAAMHKLSERLGHLEALSAVFLYGAFAWGRAREP